MFGWILTGPVPTSTFISNFSTTIGLGDEDTLAKTLWRFWEIEDIPSKPRSSAAYKYCEEYYAQTTIHGADRRYTVSLPFKDNFPFDVC